MTDLTHSLTHSFSHSLENSKNSSCNNLLLLYWSQQFSNKVLVLPSSLSIYGRSSCRRQCIKVFFRNFMISNRRFVFAAIITITTSHLLGVAVALRSSSCISSSSHALSLRSPAFVSSRNSTSRLSSKYFPSSTSSSRIITPSTAGRYYSTTTSLNMRNPKTGKTISKQNLPSKVCVVCHRPFTWRKKWEKCWDEVTTCSKSCNASRKKEQQSNKQQGGGVIGDDDDNEGLNNTDFSSTTTSTEAVNDNSDSNTEVMTKKQLLRKQRKDDTKKQKQERRLKREGNASPDVGRKSCQICSTPVDMLIRCTIDETQQYKMICGKCWPSISGGIPDGNSNTHPYYNYGGLWKNRNASGSKRIGNGSSSKGTTTIATEEEEEYEDDDMKLLNEELKNALHIETTD